MNHAQFLIRIADVTLDASPDELAIILSLAERINAGRTVYGALETDTDRRDWTRETFAELADALVYSLIKLQVHERMDRVTDPAPAPAAEVEAAE